MWSVVTKQESAAGKLYDADRPGRRRRGDPAGGRRARREAAEVLLPRGEINAQGYRFLQEDKVKEATAMFRVNVELFPDSWNVYDSLGEALLKAGDIRRRGRDVREVGGAQPGEQERQGRPRADPRRQSRDDVEAQFVGAALAAAPRRACRFGDGRVRYCRRHGSATGEHRRRRGGRVLRGDRLRRGAAGDRGHDPRIGTGLADQGPDLGRRPLQRHPRLLRRRASWRAATRAAGGR